MTFYLIGAGAYCTFLIYMMFQDQECSNYNLSSWIVIAIASLLWMIVIPVSILEIFKKDKVQLDSNFSETSEVS